MRTPKPLPRTLGATPFTVASALEAGLDASRMRRSDLERPFHGVRSPVAVDAVAGYLPKLRPVDRFSHTTALALWGAPLPKIDTLLHVTTAPHMDGLHADERRARGVIGHRSATGRATTLNGVPLSDPVTAFVEAASMLSHADLVAVGDFLVLDPRVLEPGPERPFVRLGDLREAARVAAGRGVVRARAAATAVREGVESRKETALRLLLMDADLPEPQCGYELRETRRRIGWFDLAWPSFKVIAEYDGDRHRVSTNQYERDIRRFDQAAEEDWTVVRVRKYGIQVDRAGTVARVRRALERGGWSRGQNVPHSG